MSYSRSTFKASSTSYRLSSDGDDTPTRASFRSTRSVLDSDDNLSSFRRTTRTSLADDLGSTRRTSRGISIDDDSSAISSSVRRSTRLSSRLASEDDIDSGFTSRRTNRFGSSTAGDDEYTVSARRTTRMSTGGNDDFELSSKRSTRLTSAESGDDEFGVSARRLTRLSSSGVDDELGFSTKRSNRKLSSEWSLKEDSDSPTSFQRQSSTSSKAEDSSNKYSYRRSQISADDNDPYSASGFRSTKLSMSYEKDDSSDASVSRVRTSKQSSIESIAEKDGNVYTAILDYSPPRSATDEISLKEGQEVIVFNKDKPNKWKVRTRRTKEFPKSEEGFVPSCYLEQKASSVKSLSIEDSTAQELESIDPKIKEAQKKRDGIVKELIETEEDFGRDMQFVANTYLRQLESAITPKELKDSKEVLFGCFKEIVEFHNDVLLKSFQYYTKEPSKVGCAFTKLERDFDKHVRYCRDLPEALKLLENPGPVRDHFNDYSRKIKDDKKLEDHLKLPLQRINDYQLLLKELIKYTSKLNEETGDLEKSFELIQAIPKRASDLQYISNIEGFKGNQQKLGSLLKQVLRAKDWFDVTDSDGNTNERFVFLFRGRMFITDVNKEVGPEKRSYNVVKIIKLQDVEFDGQDSNTIVVKSKEPNKSGFPLKLKAKSIEQKDIWFKEIIGTNIDDEEDEPIIEESLKEKLELSEAQEESAAQKRRPEEAKDADDKSTGQPTSLTQTSFEDISETKVGECDAKVEILEDFEAYEEMTTAMTGTLRSASITSADASKELDTTPNKPKIRKTIKSLSEHEGETATLECEIDGTPTPSVQWLKDNELITPGDHFITGSNGHKHYLIIKDINADDVGLYTVAATNSLGTSSSSSAINVLPGIGVPKVDSRPTSPGGTILPHAPKFKVKLKDTELMDGTTVRFELVVRGMPIPSVKFYKDDKELIENDRIRILYESKEVFEIMIDHVTAADSGVYKCVAVNSEGKDETSGKITVTKDKVVFLGLKDGDEPTYMPNNGSLSPRSRSPMFKWFKDGKEFEASERFQVQFDDQEDTIALIFQHVKPEDAGLYTCVASTSSGKISCSAELTVQGMVNQLPREPQFPTIKVDLADVEVSEGASAMLEAKIIAYPKPKIIWYKEEELIQSGTKYKFLYEDEESYTLVIKNCKKEDAGKYRVCAQNELGEAQTMARLSVNVAPKFKTQLKDQSVMTDGILKLEVEVEAIPIPEVKWFKDGQQLKDGKRIKLLNESENVYDLVIEKVKLEDAGNYSCVVSNDLGQQTGYSLVKVNAPPVFKSKLESVSVLEGERAELIVKINGNPKPSVKFLKDGQLVKDDGSRVQLIEEGKETYKLVLNKSNSLDAGTYACIATNDYGEEECDAELTIKSKNSKPKFVKKLQDCEAKEDDEMIELIVKVEGFPKPNIKWLRENSVVNEKEGFKFVNDEANDSYTLVIPKVKADKAGKYSCEATNSEGKEESSGILTVNSPPHFIKKLQDLNVGEGEEVKLNVKLTGRPSPKVKWYRDNALIQIDDKRYKVEEDSNDFTLIIKSAVKEDEAVYKVVAENVFGKCESTGKLGVSTKPTFIKFLSDTEAIEYESNIELVVKTDSQVSKPIIKWFIDEQEIKESDKRYKLVANEKDNTYKLVILSATEDLIGRYKCTATNTYGTAETSAKFNVITKPKFIKGLENIEVNEGETVSMTVKVKGSPEPEVKFLKDGRDVSTEATIVIKKEVDDIYILEIENIRIIMSGEYQCHIKNKAGEAFSNGTVVVNSKPKIVKDLEDKDSWVNEDVVLEVVVTGNPTPEITWFKDGKKVAGTERIILESREEVYKLKLDKANVEDSGIYKIKAINKSGEIQSKDAKLNINKTDDSGAPIFVKQIMDSLVVTGDAVRFEAQVEGKPKPKVLWSKSGLELKPSDKIQIKDEDNTHVLIIKDLQISDSGPIVCKAQNSKGQASDRAELIVNEPESPTIFGLSDVAVLEEETAKLEAKITGLPKPIVSWYKDGQEVDQKLVYNEPNSDKYCLTIKNVTEDLTGKYMCNASNIAGEAQESAELTISGKKPKFIRELEDSITMSIEKEHNKLKLGQNALFEAEVVGIPTPKVIWLKNGNEMVPDDRITITNIEDEHKLEIKTIAKEDVAQYVCKAVNKHGEASSICLLKYMDEEQAPIIKRELPKHISLEEKNQLHLEAKVDGEPLPTTEWTKDGKPVKPSENIKIEAKPDGTVSLTIESAKLEDSGIYKLKATNPKGEVSTTSEVKVELPQRAPLIQKELPLQIKIEDGKPLNLIAKVDGQPLPEVQWTKDGVPIKLSESIKIDTKPDGTVALTINKVNSKDSGVYVMKATNPIGEVCSSTTVQVLAPQMAPILKKKLPKTLKIEEGNALELKAIVEGVPTPEVKWIKDGVPLISSDSIKIETKPDGTVALNIEKAKANDAGVYKLIASNPIGEISSSSTVDVIKPQMADVIIKKLPESIEVSEGQTLNLIAKVDGKPLPEIQWTKDGKPIQPSNDVIIETKPDGSVALSIDCAKPQDSGRYGLIARTPSGEMASYSDVDVKKGDIREGEFAKKLPDSVNVVEGKPLNLTAKVDGLPISEVEWTKDGKPLKPSNDLKIETKPDGTICLSIECAKPQDSGKYGLLAKTPSGELATYSDVSVEKGDQKAITDNKKPEFIKSLLPLSIEEGKPCRLECQVSGQINSISWFKKGEEIKPNEHFGFVKEPNGTIALLIDAIGPQDAGEYRVVVKNNAGEAFSSAPVEMVHKAILREKPIFLEQLSPSNVMEGNELRMTAKIKSNLPLSVKWMKDGVEIEANDRIKMSQLPDGTVILNINNANLDDAGKYVVVAINDEGRTRSSAAASVGPKKLSKPEILEGLEPTTLTSGQPGKLSVKTSGEPTPDVRFIKDGKQLIPNDRVHIKSGPEGKVELIFDDVKPEDEGKYIAVAVNDVGETRSSAPVVVNRSPKFEQPLKEMTGIEGYPAKLETKVEGRPKPDIEWTKDGETLKPDESHFKAFTGDDGTHALLIDNCTPDDSGTYGVIASNPFGKTETSAPFTVKSKSDESGPEFAPGFVDSLQDILVNEGEPMIFVTTIKANPMPSIEWFFEGKPIKSSENIQISFDGIKAQLKIAKCNVHNKGLYEVKISNSLGDATSKAVGNIVEKSAPKFIQRLTDTESGITEPLKLICRVKGFPEPNIEWYFNGSRIEPGINYSIFKELDVCTLVIVKPKDKDSGLYECKATNICGTDSSKANITFSDQEGKGEAVSFLKQLGDCEVRPGKIAKFTACVTGSPRPEIKWFKGGVEFEPSGHKYNVEYHRNGMIRFEIRDVEESDLGEYRCHASNIHGYDNSKAQLTFESLDDKHKRKPAEDESDKYKKSGIPVPLPDKPRITRMNDQDLTLSWLPSIPIQPRIPVTYIVEWAKAPDGEWVAFRTGIKDSQCDVHGLSTGEDYSFRIRVENKFGISDPSPYVTAFRSKLQPPIQPTSQKPKGFELEHPPLDKQATAPRFLREEEEVVYGIRGQPVTIEFWVYAHPDPNIIWSFEGEKLQMGGKYDSLQDRNGQICLFITRMTESDVGIYSCLATNERGEAIKRIKLLIAEPPVFTKLLEETTVFSHRHARLECTVIGVPEPTVKWYKDWQPIHESNRIKILWESPDRATLFINGAITRDAGLYSCTASNIAGNASTSAMLHIEESEIEYDKYTFGYHKLIKPKTKPFEEFYDIGDELGRGTQGIVYHSVERTSGKSYASKIMHGKDQMREYMNSELDIMNQLGYHPKLIRIWDAFASTPHSLTLITDLCGGGELLECILQKATLTESDVAYYVRQILQGIEYLHFKNIAHFGLTIGDVLVERVNGNDIKIGDFGLAQRVIPGINYYVEFGHPEFVAPEILNKEPATFVSDVWSAGIITYLLLTGISPFLGENDRQTLQNLQTGKIDLTNETLADISDEGRDFLSKVLVFDPHRRLDVKSALQHPWLRRGDQPGIGDQLHSLQNLRLYRKKWKSWYMNASCKTYYRRRPLHSCFTHPSRMIYPPDEQYTPPPSPEREVRRSKFKPSQFDETMKQKISRDPIDAHSESQYQCGPDTYLLQLRDTDFATRIRQYLRVGASRSPSLAASLKEPHWGDSNIGYGYSPQVAVRERRKFTDIMDEEIGDEKKGLETRPKPTRLLREVGTSGYAYGQLYHMKKEASVNVGKDIHSIHESKAPFFREKLKDITIKENDDVVFSCYAIGSPPPSYTWFRNDGILIESSRIEVKRTNEGRCELRIKPARAYDTGYYKCVARNTEGAVVCRSRLNIGDSPGMPEPPQVKDGSDTEIYLCWSPPKDEGHCHIVCYKLEYQKTEESNWTVVADNIMHEFYVVRNLEPENSYYFRISARNKFGWSIPSFYSEMAKTLASGDAVRIKVPASRIYRQLVTERSAEVTIDDMLSIPNIDYSKEQNPIPLITEEHNNLYKFISEISRGRFSLITKTFVNELDSTLVSKAVLTQSEIESGIYNEYETMKSLANERIVELHYASRGSSIYVLSMESLSGIDVLTFLSQRQKYTEELVSKIIIQVMDAIEYLHFRGICLLELQPDNVLIINQRKHDIKLCDFANARRVPIAGSKVTINGTPEYIAPELIKNEEVSQSTDIWCVGVLTYILLSGVSPFRGSTDSETAQNVVYVRYLFDQLYPEITQEAIRFILTIFKLTPHKRPTVEECADHKWLLPNEFMIKKRESAVFSSHKLTEFADEFHSAKSRSMPSRLANIAGISLARSDSLLNDKYEEF